MNLNLIVSNRGEGKTTALIGWMLRGHPITGHPGWSRAIVCLDKNEVARVKREVLAVTAKPSFQASLSDQQLKDLRKAVWTYAELPMNALGTSEDFEYAVDNLDIAMFANGSALSRVFKRPAFATITATVFSPQEVIDNDPAC